MKKMNFSKNFKKGFTLIELLVVVAIIGILTAIVLASLGTTRAKGADAGIKSDLAGIRSQAELLYVTYGGYGIDATPTAFAVGVCANTADTLFANGIVWGQVSHAVSTSGGLRSCMSTANSWAVGVQMKQNSTTSAWCVDSAGNSKKETLDGTPTQTELDVLITNGTIALCD